MNEQEMQRLANRLIQTPGPDGGPLFGGVAGPCPHGTPDGRHPSSCPCDGTGALATLDLNRWLMAIGTDAEFHLLPTGQYICVLPQTTARSAYQPMPVAALLDAINQAVRGL